MSEEKKEPSFLDKMFDYADQALTPMEKVLGEPEEKAPIEVWNEAFEEQQWGFAKRKTAGDGAWHQFDEGNNTAACGADFEPEEISNRKVLNHNIVIPACASCIIAVTK